MKLNPFSSVCPSSFGGRKKKKRGDMVPGRRSFLFLVLPKKEKGEKKKGGGEKKRGGGVDHLGAGHCGAGAFRPNWPFSSSTKNKGGEEGKGGTGAAPDGGVFPCGAPWL